MPSGGGNAGGGRSGSAHSARSRGPSASRTQAGDEDGKGRAKHEAKAVPHYYLPRPAVGGAGRAMDIRPSRIILEPAADLVDQHQKYNEHPFLLQKDFQLNRDVGKTCLSFGVPPQVRNNRWQEDDRDTNQGRCKYNRDCRLGHGPDHTDPKPARIRDRFDSQGKLVLRPKPENVPVAAVHEKIYKVMEKPDVRHHYRAPPPPFKGAGGARVCWGRDLARVEVNLGHGHGVYEHQQYRGPEGRLPLGQLDRKVPLSDGRRALVRKAWAGVAGAQDARAVARGRLVRCLKTRQLHAVVSRQQSEEEAKRELLEQMMGSSDPEAGPEEVTYVEFESYWERRSWQVTDDGFFALLLHNHFPSSGA